MAREVEAEAAGVEVLLRDRGAEVSIKLKKHQYDS